jgi:hypothetical protein
MSYEQYNFLSQVFTVQDSTGVYLTSVDLFFAAKDETLPVSVQLREVIQGTPSNTILPFSEVTLRPSEVDTSFDASRPTRFTFPAPVYLSGPIQQDVRGNTEINRVTKEYALVVVSSSSKYLTYSANIGSLDSNLGDNINSSNQPFVKSLFKPKTSSTWEPSTDEVLKFVLRRASFNSEGIVRFFNPLLDNANYETVTSANNFQTLSKKIIIGLSSSNYNSTIIVPGVTISQESATGKLVGIAGSVHTQTGIGVTVINPGIGYSVGTYTNIPLITQTGLGQGAKATIGVSTVGVSTVGIVTVTITDGGFGYVRGDLLTIGDITGNSGYGVVLGVSSIRQNNSLVLDNVQGTFSIGINTVNYINSSGITTSLGVSGDIRINNLYEDPLYDGLHMKVYHVGHNMNSFENYVQIKEFYPLITETNSKLTAEFSTESTLISVQSSSGFETFEGIVVDETNPGYVIIGNEVVEYTGISGNNLTGITRGIDAPLYPGTVNTIQYGTYPIGTYVYKYEMKGVSLRRINKVHKLSEVDNITSHPIDIDSYYIKINTSNTDFEGKTIGKDREGELFFSETSLTGDYGTHLTQNIQYSSLVPIVKNIVPTSTSIQGRVRTFSATSSNGNENSFEDQGYTDVSIGRITTFDAPRLIASTVNEQRNISDSPGNRSFDMEFVLSTTDERVSPLLDLEEVSVRLNNYRLNQPISLDEYATNDSIRGLTGDPHACIYISKPVFLNFPSNSLKVLLSAYTGATGNIRVLYRLFSEENPNISLNYELFPGYSNYQTDSNGIRRVIDPAFNDGTSDKFSDLGSYLATSDFEYTADDLPSFTGFSIKVILSGTNQADPPYLNDIRAIANIKP